MPRRTLLRASAGGVLALFARPGLPAAQPPAQPAPAIGAIRWDAWYAPLSPETQAVTRALAPRPYHFRLPFFAKVDPDGGVRIDGGTQATMDAEIEQASRAGIDYWAFVAYRPDSGMSVALRLYLASVRKPDVHFCMFTELVSFGANGRLAPMVLDHVRLMRDPQYMRVTQGRPLYFIGFFTPALIDQRWGGIDGLRRAFEDFRHGATQAGLGNPYIVLCGGPAAAARWADQLGLDAIGAYAIAGSGTHPYRDLAALTERRWDEEAATGVPVVPTVMTGWDARPRIETPVPWQPAQQPGVGMENHYETAQPAEIAAHLGHALDWVEAHRRAAVANTVLIYAWDENDEGGWLVPTFPFDDSRLRALRTAVCSWRARRRMANACAAG
jgi:hypothetical protein